MSTESPGGDVVSGSGADTDDAVRAMVMLMPRVIGRLKRTPPPEEVQALALAPRHLSLLAGLLFDGASTVNELAARLEVAPTTVSLMVGELSRKGVLERREDEQDRRRRIVDISDDWRTGIDAWLARGAGAWRTAFEPLTPEQRTLVVDTLRAYEAAMAEEGREGGVSGQR
ncbi:MarR family transcriptional regulator [Streptomyces oceani]|uniref:MarR family transcriptional regulator n=1 Tax=Streptomyces oceani TaxID=1075402 RepID=A0A1E7KLG4_9ACTN|nr:MarR family transcriptional regulator [Streptomyces oceani]OEV04768.1 MarR family transcriptional regulator [Streptomyces oceani]